MVIETVLAGWLPCQYRRRRDRHAALVPRHHGAVDDPRLDVCALELRHPVGLDDAGGVHVAADPVQHGGVGVIPGVDVDPELEAAADRAGLRLVPGVAAAHSAAAPAVPRGRRIDGRPFRGSGERIASGVRGCQGHGRSSRIRVWCSLRAMPIAHLGEPTHPPLGSTYAVMQGGGNRDHQELPMTHRPGRARGSPRRAQLPPAAGDGVARRGRVGADDDGRPLPGLPGGVLRAELRPPPPDPGRRRQGAAGPAHADQPRLPPRPARAVLRRAGASWPARTWCCR